MDPMLLAIWIVGGTVCAGLLVWGLRSARTGRRHAALAERSEALGLREPPSLHPVIDEHVCICTGACVVACPEKDVLGMVGDKPVLLNPTACIGHGECLRACPVEAITLVIGTQKRGVDLPLLGSDFQTNVPGLYIAGELGGMGLIHNAVNQGGQAMRAIAASLKTALPPLVSGGSGASGASGDSGASGASVQGSPAGGEPMKDVIVVGAGPAGLSAALQAKALGLDFAVLEQESLGGALLSFPRQKVVMTAPVVLALHGKVKLRRTSKEALLELWAEIVRTTGVSLDCGVKVNGVKRVPEGFIVETSAGERRARRVLLAVGRRGTPRKLGVPGESLEKVTYKLIEPEQYRQTHCAVFGGGDSAVETALMLAKEPGTTVTLIHRSERFDRIKPGNQDALAAAREGGRLSVKTGTRATVITAEAVHLDGPAGSEIIANHFVFACLGGELPTAWLAKMGVDVKTFHGEAYPAVRS